MVEEIVRKERKILFPLIEVAEKEVERKGGFYEDEKRQLVKKSSRIAADRMHDGSSCSVRRNEF